MSKKAIRITVIILSSILLAMILLIVITLYRQNPESSQYYPEPDITEETPETTSEIVEVESITILLDNEILRGTRFWPEIIINPENATDKFYDIRTDNESVLQFRGGYWIAGEIGRASLIVTAANGVTARLLVTVTAPELEALSFISDEETMVVGEIILLTPVLEPDEAFMFEPIIYESDNERVATVSYDGRVTAVSVGEAIITGSVGDITAEVKISVIIPARRINVVMNRRVYSVGDTATFTIEVEPPNATNASVTVSFAGAAVTTTGSNSFRCDEAGEVVVTFTAENGSTISHAITVHDLAVLAQEVHRLTNIERSNLGIQSLGSSQSLSRLATIRAREIITSFSHTRPDGREFFTVFDDNEVEYRRAGENLAAGQLSPAEAVRSWMTSTTGHREALLNAEFNNLGVGVTMDDEGRLYWTQIFSD